MDVGFIGLGIMGRPMADHLINAGHRLFLYDVKPVPDDLTSKGGTACASAKEVASKAEIIITMVPDTPHVEAALFGPEGVAKGLSEGKTVVDMSSIAPIETKRFAAEINKLGCDYLDAPVSGGEVGAKAASLTIMVGGPERAFEKVKPLFEKMGKNITLVGGNSRTPSRLADTVCGLTLPTSGAYCWFAGEAAESRAIRKHLRGNLRWDRRSYDVIGYWRVDAERWTQAYVERGAELFAVYRQALDDGKSEKQASEEFDEALERAGL